ncbi:MAG: hypothetical protein QHJ73_02330, partial [Armatimonadota bacterium]|nr:hypothetical protein [Armatimonadota bacterium]
MDWSSAMSDLANSWKVGVAVVALVLARFVLTASVPWLARWRTLFFSGVARLFGGGPTPCAGVPAAQASTTAVELSPSGGCSTETAARPDFAGCAESAPFDLATEGLPASVSDPPGGFAVGDAGDVSVEPGPAAGLLV